MCRTYLLKFAIIVLLSSNLTTSAQITYRNPVIPGFHPDPSVCRVGDDYYLVTSTFEYFPGVPVFQSKDLVNWQQIGHCLTRESQLPLMKCRPSGGIYAPTIRFHEGLYYMVTTNVSGGGNFFVTAKDPAGKWSEPLWVNQGGIDPTIFWDDDGKVYFMSNGHQFGDGKYREGIMISEIDLKTGKRITEPISVWHGTGGRYPEAPHIYKKDGYCYLLIAEGGTEYGHMVTIARSKSIYGPYLPAPANPILTHFKNKTQTSPIQGTGHADLIETQDGSWWVVFLAFRPQNGSHHLTGRETYLAPVSWPQNGWPIVNGDGSVTLEMNCPTLPLKSFAAKPDRDEFSTAVPGLEWNYLRNPFMENYLFDSMNSKLILKGTGLTLNDIDSPTFLGRRQEHINFSATASLEFRPSKLNEEAGITTLMNNGYHFDFIKTKDKLVLRYQLGSITHLAKELAVETDKVQLRIEGSDKHYTFSYSIDGARFVIMGKADTNLISTETAGGFTGVYLGLFTTGNGAKCDTPAVFDWFEYKGI